MFLLFNSSVLTVFVFCCMFISIFLVEGLLTALLSPIKYIRFLTYLDKFNVTIIYCRPTDDLLLCLS